MPLQFCNGEYSSIWDTLTYLVPNEDTRQGKDTWIEWEMNAKCQQWYPIVYLYIICGMKWLVTKTQLKKTGLVCLFNASEKIRILEFQSKGSWWCSHAEEIQPNQFNQIETRIYSYPRPAFIHQN